MLLLVLLPLLVRRRVICMAASIASRILSHEPLPLRGAIAWLHHHPSAALLVYFTLTALRATSRRPQTGTTA